MHVINVNKQKSSKMRVDGRFNSMFGLPCEYWINCVKKGLTNSRKVSTTGYKYYHCKLKCSLLCFFLNDYINSRQIN